MRPVAIIVLAVLPFLGSKPTALTPVELARIAERSTVKIAWQDDQGTHVCSSFVVDSAKGYLLTAAHCVPPDIDGAVVYTPDGQPHDVIAADGAFALIQISKMQYPVLELRKGKASPGEPLLIAGFPYSWNFSILVRYVSSWDKGDVRMDGPMIQGMSGGPVLDEQGRVVGINQGSDRNSFSLSIACGSDEIRDFLRVVERR